MISEQDKQAILNGAYGVTNDGRKAKYIGSSASNDYPYYFIFFNNDNEISKGTSLTKDFRELTNTYSDFDIIGLWQNKPEPFNLEKALAGEPVMLRNGLKANILKQIKDTLIGYFDECSPFSWDINGDASLAAESNHDIIGMWKEPEPVSNTVTLTLPCPLKEPKDDMWFIGGDGVAMKSDYQKDIPTRTFNKDKFNNGFYFNSKEDAQAWLDAFKNNRR